MNIPCTKVIRWHLHHYPELDSRDLVKLAFQAVFGNHHMQDSLESIKKRLVRELNHAGVPLGDSRLTDPLGPQTGWLRVHLNPFAQRGGDAESLAAAVFHSLAIPGGDPENFFHYLRCIQHQLNEDDRNIPGSPMAQWEIRFRESGLAPVHHSELFRRKYRPAYRVIHASSLQPANLLWLNAFREFDHEH